MTTATQTTNDKTRPKVKTLPTWQIILSMIRYRPWLWTINLISMMVLVLFWQAPALLMREFFNLLTGDATVRLGIVPIVILLFALELGRFTGRLGLIKTNVPFFVHISSEPTGSGLSFCRLPGQD